MLERRVCPRLIQAMRRAHNRRRLCGENGPCLLKQAIRQAQRNAAARRDGRGRGDHRERDPGPRQRLVRRHGDMRAIKRENDINEQLSSQNDKLSQLNKGAAQ